jgi:hypothetical protein
VWRTRHDAVGPGVSGWSRAPHDALDSSIAPSHFCICIIMRAYEYIAKLLRCMSAHLLYRSLCPLPKASPAAHPVATGETKQPSQVASLSDRDIKDDRDFRTSSFKLQASADTSFGRHGVMTNADQVI